MLSLVMTQQTMLIHILQEQGPLKTRAFGWTDIYNAGQDVSFIYDHIVCSCMLMLTHIYWS